MVIYMRKHNHNYLLIHALLALHDMVDVGVPGYSDPSAEAKQRYTRWLDALVPPGGYLPEDEEEGHDQADAVAK